jgi:CRISPR-associated protein Csm2
MYQNNNNRSFGNNSYSQKAEVKSVNIHFNEKDEITSSGKDYVDVANDVVKSLKPGTLTTSKIRSILSMIAEIYKVTVIDKNQVLNNDIVSQLQYYKIRCIYEAGREPAVKYFINNANIDGLVKEIGDSKKRLINYYHYMEALVAWFKYNGGKD